MDKFELIATATFGLEAVVARELKELGYVEQKVENGKVTFWGVEKDICRTNLWLRSADRILIKMGEFQAHSFDELFEKTKALNWPDWIPQAGNFPVVGKSVRSKLFSVPDCQAIVKKAVVEKMKQKYKQEWFDENGPRYRIEVALLKDIATLTIDTTGPGLHKRGYRKLSSDAPLKETLAAAMIQLSYWNSDRILADPLCGSGTIPIEAALIGLNMAPGLKRSFIAEEWERIPRKYWDEARQEAQDLMQKERKLEILASDIDGDVLSMARYHIDQAGLQDHIKLQKLPVSEFRSRKKYGCIITNPPYGERLGEADEVKKLYQEMGKVFKPLGTWSIYILTSYPGFEQLFGRKADKRRKLYNGRIECQYYQYYGPRPPKREED